MTLTPAEAAENNDQKHADQVEEAICYFDSKLSQNWFTGRTELSIPEFKMALRIYNEVFASYEKVGWRIKSSIDHKDRRFWTFSKK